ncbi:MAG: hypothetical protein GPOALKHO_001097 [Sodalis sp.]|nr:MAG: hypothetical protein GPOALKHO_001097 [Sodalis sp.]
MKIRHNILTSYCHIAVLTNNLSNSVKQKMQEIFIAPHFIGYSRGDYQQVEHRLAIKVVIVVICRTLQERVEEYK